MNPKVDEFISKAKLWQAEITLLREIMLKCPVTEEFKWWQPVYTVNKKNVAIISGFKEYCVLSFFNGALLKDERKLLSKPGPNTRGVRLFRFTSTSEIAALEAIITEYISEAIAIENAGLKFNYKENATLTFPEEFVQILNENPALQSAFNALTPGRQRAYNLHFSSPKQSKTRTARVVNCIPRILEGKGLSD